MRILTRLLVLGALAASLSGCAALGFLAMGCDSGSCVMVKKHHAARHHHAFPLFLHAHHAR